MAYSDKLIDHYENPRNIGSLDKNSEDVGTGLVGDLLVLFATICWSVYTVGSKPLVDRYGAVTTTATRSCGQLVLTRSSAPRDGVPSSGALQGLQPRGRQPCCGTRGPRAPDPSRIRRRPRPARWRARRATASCGW